MKPSSTLPGSLLLSTVLLFAGCNKKPERDATPGETTTVVSNENTPSARPPSIDAPPPGLENRGANGVIETADMIRGLFQPVYFGFDQSNIKESERPKLQEVVKYLAEHPTYRILLEGHCDWRGTAEYNLGLGDRRANSGKRYLTGIKVPADKLETLSKGSLDAPEKAPEEQMAKDRRLEIIVLKK